MDEKKDQLITYIRNLVSNPNLTKIGNATKIIYRLVAHLVALVAMLVGYVEMIKVYGDNEQSMLFFKIIFWGAFIANAAFFISELLKLISVRRIEKVMNGFSVQIEYDELVRMEKILRKSILICDAISEFIRSGVAFLIGLLFVIGGIYMGVTGQGGSLLINLMCIIIFPLMGGTAIFFICEPFIHILKELFRVDQTDWEDYINAPNDDKNKKPKKIKDIKMFLFGAVFFSCGLLAFLEGFTFIPEGEIGQCIGMNLFGLVFMAVGGFNSYYFGIKGKKD